MPIIIQIISHPDMKCVETTQKKVINLEEKYETV